MRGVIVVLLAVCAAAPMAPAASAPLGAPRVGDCFDVSGEQLQAGGWWTPSPAVPCTQSHTFEVTETGPLPADADAFAYAADRCGDLDVWTSVGVNVPAAGVVVDPLRIEARSFTVRQSPAVYVCGAVAVESNGRGAATPVALSASIERLGRRALAALRHCSSAEGGRRATAPAITVACSTRPRWQVTSWVVWTAFYDAYPGRAALREHAARLCGPRTVASLPPVSSWAADAPPRTWCFQLYP